MSEIFPIHQNFKVVEPDGKPTSEFLSYMGQILSRIGGILGGTYSQLTDAASIVWDLNLYPVAVVVLGGNRTIPNPLNMVAGKNYQLTVVQDATGSRTLSWGSAFKWPGGTAPTLTTAANAVDEFWFSCDGTNVKQMAKQLDLR